MSLIEGKTTMRTLSLSLAVLILASLTPAQEGWVRVPTKKHPPLSIGCAATYDPIRNHVILFGGRDSSYKMSAETWKFDGVEWTRLSPTSSPPARYGASMVFDSRRGRAVLFGGSGSAGALRDTWEWDGTNWKDRFVTTRPLGRTGHGMVYDPLRDRIVLFSGNSLTDTWEWDGTRWIQRTPKNRPPGQGFGAAVLDSRHAVLFHGGYPSKSDLWRWDGTDWSAVKQNTNVPRGGHGLVLDPNRGVVVMCGGNPDSPNLTWEWDGTQWATFRAATPPARELLVAAYCGRTQSVILFGGMSGRTSLSDTWRYERYGPKKTPPVGADAPSLVHFGKSCGPRPQPTFTLTTGTRPSIGKAIDITVLDLNSPFAGLLTAGSRKVTPLPLDRIGLPGCHLYHSMDLAWYFHVRNKRARVQIPIPYAPQIVGSRVYFQAAAGSSVTRGAEVTIDY